MEIFLIRHAEAVDHSASVDDSLRPLTARGRKRARKLGKRLHEIGVLVDAIVTSPLVRAVQSAELVAVGLRFKDALDVAVELSPSRSAASVIAEVLMPRGVLGAVAIVGHEPLFGNLLRELLHAPAPSPSKGSAIRLSWDGIEQPAVFHWVMKPGYEQPSTKLDDVE